MMNFFRKILRDQRGFTLIELIIVVTILAVLAGVALLNSGGTEEDARIAKAKTDVAAIATAVKVYQVKVGSYPATLNALISDNGDYKAMLDELPENPFAADKAYVYSIDATTGVVTISTSGTSPKVTRTLK